MIRKRQHLLVHACLSVSRILFSCYDYLILSKTIPYCSHIRLSQYMNNKTYKKKTEGNNEERWRQQENINREHRRERVRCLERVMRKQTQPYGKQTASGNLLCDSERKQGLCDNLQWGGKVPREGTCVSLWLLLVDVWQKTTKLSNYSSI